MPNFVSFAASIAELSHEEKLCTQSPSLDDAPGTEACASENHINHLHIVHKRDSQITVTQFVNTNTQSIIKPGEFQQKFILFQNTTPSI